MNDLPIFQENRKLSELSTFGIGGHARYFIEAHEIAEMQKILIVCRDHKLPYFILGKGSNCLFDDQGFHGVVIANRIDFLKRPEEDVFHVGAGYNFSLLGVQTARQGWAGLEFASGIPGSVGGAVYMNAGANGLETCQSIISVDFITEDGELVQIPRANIEFAYRFSSFQKQIGAIVGASFRLTLSSQARTKQLEIIHYRKETQPYGAKSAGCIFRNPSCGSAGALIDRSGLKGKTVGGAQISTKHGNFVINTGEATSKDVLTLLDLIKKEIKEKMGVELQSEVCYIPYNWTNSENHA
jgi:UDP-N-acetylmuramate dehydrogenase